ncbi:MAG: HAD family acid phosphatase [Rhizomicrobium sp.]
MKSGMFVGAMVLGAIAFAAAPAAAAPLTYDCQARMTRVETIPPVAPGDTHPWQCPMPGKNPSSAVHWQRNSLEYCRMALNVYDQALSAARRMAKKYKAHQWIVLMDADETVLDNSLFERERLSCGGDFQDAQWESWVAADMARDVPGAAAFTAAVQHLGGLVGIVTNRKASDDAITQDTLKKAGIHFDYEVGMTDSSDKTTRWRGAVTALARRFGGHPKAVLWIGDQVTDFAVVDAQDAILRAMGQDDRGDGGGDHLFLLPNPMYGGWSDNPDR